MSSRGGYGSGSGDGSGAGAGGSSSRDADPRSIPGSADAAGSTQGASGAGVSAEPTAPLSFWQKRKQQLEQKQQQQQQQQQPQQQQQQPQQPPLPSYPRPEQPTTQKAMAPGSTYPSGSSSSRDQLEASLLAANSSVAAKMEQLEQRARQLLTQPGDASHPSSSFSAAPQPSTSSDAGIAVEMAMLRISVAKLAENQEKFLAEAQAEKDRIRRAVRKFEPLLRGPQLDPDAVRGYSLSRQTWLDFYAGRLKVRDNGEPPSSVLDLLPPSEPLPQRPPHERVENLRFNLLGGCTLQELGLAEELPEISRVLQEMAARRAFGNGPQASGSGSRQEQGDVGDNVGMQQAEHGGQGGYYRDGPGPSYQQQPQQQQQQQPQGYGPTGFGFTPTQQAHVADRRMMHAAFGSGSNFPNSSAPGYGYHPGASGANGANGGGGGGGYR
ncbi:unnamed protein product [Tilletia controversa]|nr:unnamed protein product [Tilletia controversa]CAD6914187.1 unnamed protein product [Tilletia controversa]CAD6932913.1 unnamed protein product [Tilletia controversa]